ncbi:CoA transferase [Streptomyces sp. WAC08241]|uniref:CoA transferase n=1 Tax=Streptomyces sp. WAC08241 TaxID=2487421 RepID=UPI000F7B765E|nr:CoA transferase [Streptomyces sp. WAC08241]RSS38137.1 CoA transferase [Streptomyces sp. WAC08241]
MASPATTAAVRPLDATAAAVSGPAPVTAVVAAHLRRLGARQDGPGTPDPAGGTVLSGEGFAPVRATARWGAPGSGLVDEATVQAATGIMAVHGRRDGAPAGLAADCAATATGVLVVQGLLAALIGQARGAGTTRVDTGADLAGLLAVSQYLAAAGADEGEAAELAPGGPPFTSVDGVLFELETLDPGAWAAFWRALDAPADAIRAGWRPFQFRYATACAPFPPVLHATTRRRTFAEVRRAAALSGAQVCALRTLAERYAEAGDAAPWDFRLLGGAPAGACAQASAGARAQASTGARTEAGTGARTEVRSVVAPAAPRPSPGRPLAGLTVLEAGRRIQAPLAAHLLGLLGAEVVRIEPPGGDPLRGMPPACSGVSARWLALNRGKEAVEIDIKSPGGRRELRAAAAGADVFLHNWAPGKAAELGLDSDDLARDNPALVYAYTGGWGGRVPDAPMGTDFMVQARTGVGEAVRPEGEPPAPSLMTLLDVLGGLHGAEAVLAGLLLRERTGRGVRVDSSLLGAADTLTAPALDRIARGRSPRMPAGFRRPLPVADGWIAPADADAAAVAAHDLSGLPTGEALALLQDRGLAATKVTTDLSDLRGDPRFTHPIHRDAHGAPAVPDPWSLA